MFEMEFIGRQLVSRTEVPKMLGGNSNPITKSTQGIKAGTIVDELRERRNSVNVANANRSDSSCSILQERRFFQTLRQVQDMHERKESVKSGSVAKRHD